VSPAERRALTRAALLVLISGVVRWGWEVRRGPPVAPASLGSDLPELLADATALNDEERRRGEPLAEGETLELNRAGELDLDRLPGVGPSTARAIVETRDGRGGFGAVEELLDVPGIGPATLEKIRPHVELGGGAPVTARGRRATVRRVPPAPGRSVLTPEAASGTDETRDRASSATPADGTGLSRGGKPRPAGPQVPIDINRATEEELQRLPGIGPALAARIVNLRRSRGHFTSVDSLVAVRGIGPATLARIRERIVAR